MYYYKNQEHNKILNLENIMFNKIYNLTTIIMALPHHYYKDLER